MNYDMQDKVAIVTGGASGIGRATAAQYARYGAKVVVADVDEGGGVGTVSKIERNGGTAMFMDVDVSSAEACEKMVRQTVERYGRLDYACNNAGIGGEPTPLADKTVDDWQRVIGINLSGVFYCMKYEIPAMLEYGGGAIVNMASILGQVGFATASAYVAAKHGVVGLTQNAALEYAAAGLRINAIGPGFIRTPLLADMESDEETMNMLVSLHPIGRLGESDEVANLVMWLSSDESSFVNGAYYPVDGGYLAR